VTYVEKRKGHMKFETATSREKKDHLEDTIKTFQFYDRIVSFLHNGA
jgi:hypothetical protein